MTTDFSNQVVVVTGAASGIGLGTAEAFAAERAMVLILDCDAELGQKASDNIRASGWRCEFIQTDVGSESSVMAAADQISQRHGRVDHLVNNAGIVMVGALEECTSEDWDHVMNVNVKSIFLMSKHLFRFLRAAPRPTIVNVGSISSFVAQKLTPVYVASKGAVAMLSKSMALDFAQYGIRVNCVCPGITDTPLFRHHVNQTPDPELTVRNRLNRVPLNQMLYPRDIARSIVYLASAASDGITGTTLVVDGGYLAAAEWSNR